MRTLEETIELVKNTLTGTRHGGGLMYLHSVRIYESLKKYWFSESIQYAGLLHDMVEDSDYTLDQLREDGYDDRIVNLVDLVSHDERILDRGERRKKMMERCIREWDSDMWAIKVADFADNIADCDACPKELIDVLLFKRAPLFLYYGNKYFGGTPFYEDFLERYWLQMRKYHGYFM